MGWVDSITCAVSTLDDINRFCAEEAPQKASHETLALERALFVKINTFVTCARVDQSAERCRNFIGQCLKRDPARMVSKLPTVTNRNTGVSLKIAVEKSSSDSI